MLQKLSYNVIFNNSNDLFFQPERQCDCKKVIYFPDRLLVLEKKYAWTPYLQP